MLIDCDGNVAIRVQNGEFCYVHQMLSNDHEETMIYDSRKKRKMNPVSENYKRLRTTTNSSLRDIYNIPSSNVECCAMCNGYGIIQKA